MGLSNCFNGLPIQTSRGQIDSISKTATQGSSTRKMTYDAAMRLTGVANQLNQSLESYTLSPEGNRVRSHTSSLHLTDEANRLTEDEQFLYAHSLDNNLIAKTDKSTGDTSTYTYNRLDQMLTGEGVTWVYDAHGRAIRQRDATTDRRIVWDGWDAVRIDDLSNTNSLQRRTWVTHGLEQDELLALTPKTTGTTPNTGPATQSYYLHTDHQGSVIGLSNDNGQLINQYTYDSHGNLQTQVEAYPQPFRFTGQQQDLSGKLLYYKHRMYDPKTGRFLQEDPLWFEAGDLNTYRTRGMTP